MSRSRGEGKETKEDKEVSSKRKLFEDSDPVDVVLNQSDGQSELRRSSVANVESPALKKRLSNRQSDNISFFPPPIRRVKSLDDNPPVLPFAFRSDVLASPTSLMSPQAPSFMPPQASPPSPEFQADIQLVHPLDLPSRVSAMTENVAPIKLLFEHMAQTDEPEVTVPASVTSEERKLSQALLTDFPRSPKRSPSPVSTTSAVVNDFIRRSPPHHLGPSFTQSTDALTVLTPTKKAELEEKLIAEQKKQKDKQHAVANAKANIRKVIELRQAQGFTQIIYAELPGSTAGSKKAYIESPAPESFVNMESSDRLLLNEYFGMTSLFPKSVRFYCDKNGKLYSDPFFKMCFGTVNPNGPDEVTDGFQLFVVVKPKNKVLGGDLYDLRLLRNEPGISGHTKMWNEAEEDLLAGGELWVRDGKLVMINDKTSSAGRIAAAARHYKMTEPPHKVAALSLFPPESIAANCFMYNWCKKTTKEITEILVESSVTELYSSLSNSGILKSGIEVELAQGCIYSHLLDFANANPHLVASLNQIKSDLHTRLQDQDGHLYRKELSLSVLFASLVDSDVTEKVYRNLISAPAFNADAHEGVVKGKIFGVLTAFRESVEALRFNMLESLKTMYTMILRDLSRLSVEKVAELVEHEVKSPNSHLLFMRAAIYIQNADLYFKFYNDQANHAALLRVGFQVREVQKGVPVDIVNGVSIKVFPSFKEEDALPAHPPITFVQQAYAEAQREAFHQTDQSSVTSLPPPPADQAPSLSRK